MSWAVFVMGRDVPESVERYVFSYIRSIILFYPTLLISCLHLKLFFHDSKSSVSGIPF